MNKYIVVFVALFLASACGKLQGPAGKDGQSITGPKGDAGETGERGPAGEQGEAGESISVETIELCPNIPGDGFHEYLLLIDGYYYGVFFDHARKRTFMTMLLPGKSYTTTDDRNCNFSINSVGQLVQ